MGENSIDNPLSLVPEEEPFLPVESRVRKRSSSTPKEKTSAKKPRKNQDGVPAETDTSRGSGIKRVENSTNNTQDEETSPQRNASAQFGSST